MKVIFLDVDGVLNSGEGLKQHINKNGFNGILEYSKIEDKPLKLLQEIIEKTSAKIVLSSSWKNSKRLYEKLERRLRDCGMEICDITPSIGIENRKGYEIKRWLDNNEVENFVILDDEADMYLYTDSKQFIRTTYKHGLTEELKNRAIEVLNK